MRCFFTARRTPGGPEVDQDNFAITYKFRQFVNFTFRISHFEICELFADSYIFQYFEAAHHFVDTRECLERRVSLRNDFTLLFLTQIVTVVKRIFSRHFLIHVSQDIVTDCPCDLFTEFVILLFSGFGYIFIFRTDCIPQFTHFIINRSDLIFQCLFCIIGRCSGHNGECIEVGDDFSVFKGEGCFKQIGFATFFGNNIRRELKSSKQRTLLCPLKSESVVFH